MNSGGHCQKLEVYTTIGRAGIGETVPSGATALLAPDRERKNAPAFCEAPRLSGSRLGFRRLLLPRWAGRDVGQRRRSVDQPSPLLRPARPEPLADGHSVARVASIPPSCP